MKQTPITKAIEQIRTQSEDYRKRGNGDKSEALLDTINLLQSLLPYERECFEETYSDGFERPDNNYIDFKDYFYKIYKQ